jgi:hypothetical protein
MEKISGTTLTNAMVFPTFYHINDYGELGYANLSRYIATSDPLVLWAPSGRLLEECYNKKICPISPKSFIELVEKNHIHIIGREWWFHKASREQQLSKRANPWKYAQWLDSFDGPIEIILRERQSSSLPESSVRLAPPEDGEAWAKGYLERKGEDVIDKVVKLIEASKVPQGQIEKAQRALKNGGREEAVKAVLGDLRNHVEAKNHAKAKVPFLSQKDTDFFRLLETEGTIVELIKKEIVIGAEMGRAIEHLVDQLGEPHHLLDLTHFVDNILHKELASWFSRATDVANAILPQDLNLFLKDRLWEHAAKGRLSEHMLQRLRNDSLFTPDISASDIITLMASERFDSNNTLATSDVRVHLVPIQSGISRDIGAIQSTDERSSWSACSSDESQSKQVA